MATLVIGGAFLLRWYTVEHLPLWKDSNVVDLAILPEDRQIMEHRMADILSVEAVKSQIEENHAYLVYFLPTNSDSSALFLDGFEVKLRKADGTKILEKTICA